MRVVAGQQQPMRSSSAGEEKVAVGCECMSNTRTIKRRDKEEGEEGRGDYRHKNSQ